jgi:hypothetical protein
MVAASVLPDPEAARLASDAKVMSRESAMVCGKGRHRAAAPTARQTVQGTPASPNQRLAAYARRCLRAERRRGDMAWRRGDVATWRADQTHETAFSVVD